MEGGRQVIVNGGQIRVILLALVDFTTFYAILLLSAWLYKFMGGNYPMIEYVRLWPMGLILLLCNAFIRIYHGNFLYPGAALGQVEELRRLFFSVTLLYLLMFSYLFATRNVELYSRCVFMISWSGTLFFLPLSRWMLRSIMKNFGFGQIHALVAGAGVGGVSLVEELQKNRHIGIIPDAFIDDDVAKAGKTIQNIPVLGKIADAAEIAKAGKIDYIIICLPLAVIRDKIKLLSHYFRHIMIVPDNEVFPTAWAYPIDMNGRLGMELRNQLMLRGPRFVKKMVELAMATTAIIGLFPLFVLIAVLIKVTSRGPVLYSAERLGRGGKTINVLKFRTMHQDAHAALEQMLESDPALRKEWQEKFKISNDPRITPLGRLLRRSSLDELPQFFNVLKGEMAVIGPRPIVEQEKVYYGENYAVVNRVKPGITGYWQVSGRSETSYSQRVKMDMYYIMNWSVWLDIYIFLKTVKEVICCKSAY